MMRVFDYATQDSRCIRLIIESSFDPVAGLMGLSRNTWRSVRVTFECLARSLAMIGGVFLY